MNPKLREMLTHVALLLVLICFGIGCSWLRSRVWERHMLLGLVLAVAEGAVGMSMLLLFVHWIRGRKNLS